MTLVAMGKREEARSIAAELLSAGAAQLPSGAFDPVYADRHRAPPEHHLGG
jgi:hypothetical protein